MLSRVTRRLLGLGASLAVISVVVFFAFKLIPGDPALIMLGTEADPAAVAALRHDLGLDQPAVVQYGRWLGRFLQGDLGPSIRYNRPVAELIVMAFPVTLTLAVGAALVTVLLAVPLGVAAAVRRRSWLDVAITALSQVGIALPSFWLGILLIIGFALKLRWLPAGGYEPWSAGILPALQTALLPAVALGLQRATVLTRMIRGSLIEALSQDYVRTARAKGLDERIVIYRHALRNAMIPSITVFGLQLGHLVAGSIIIEAVFSQPGLGRLLLNGIGQRDLALVQALIMLAAVSVVLINFVVDLTYSWLDPRIKTEEAA